jgi:hypothetical protein
VAAALAALEMPQVVVEEGQAKLEQIISVELV